MAAFLKGRVSKLETRRRPPIRLRSNVVEYDPATGEIIGPTPPKGARVMLVPNFGDEWEMKLLAQQERLVASAGIKDETQTERH